VNLLCQAGELGLLDLDPRFQGGAGSGEELILQRGGLVAGLVEAKGRQLQPVVRDLGNGGLQPDGGFRRGFGNRALRGHTSTFDQSMVIAG
jgi:hypothetical protein